MADKTLEQMYIAAYNRIKNAATAADYREAITLLKKCNGFADSESMIQQCEEALYRLSQEETYQNALSLSEKRDVVFLRKAETLFEELGDYKDSMRRLGNVRIKIAKQSSGDPENVEIVCPKCGHINHGGSCCSKCGAPFQKAEPAGNHRKRNLLILSSIALLALVIGIAVFAHQSDSDEPIYDDDEQSELSSDDISGTDYNKQGAYTDVYMDYIDDIIASADGTESGKLVHYLSDQDYPTPDGTPARELYDRYGIADIDGDGIEELILFLSYSDSIEELMRILRYDPSAGELERIGGSSCFEGYNYKAIKFYDNGVIAASYGDDTTPSYVFVNKDLANQYDFLSYNSFEFGNRLEFYYQPTEDCYNESITNGLSVSGSREISVKEAETLMKELESGNPVPVTLYSFAGDADIVCGSN